MSKSRIDKDPELKAFIFGLPDYLRIIDIRTEAINKFGADRVPGKTAIHEYLQKLRQDEARRRSALERGDA